MKSGYDNVFSRSPSISVIVCTHNRVSLLVDALEALKQQSLDLDEFEVVVVDNASRDETAHSVATLALSMPNLTYLYEAKPGLSSARNRGIREARGEMLCFIDDDALADSHWLECIRANYVDDQSVCAVAGRVVLDWPKGHRPSWLPGRLESYYSKFDRGPRRRPLTFPEYPFGTNMAVRRSCARSLGGFSTELGRRGKSLMSGEEREFFFRLGLEGCTVAYDPEVLVVHLVQPERLSRVWLLRRLFAQGRGQIIEGVLEEAASRSRFRWLRSAMVHYLRSVRQLGRSIRAASLFGVLGPEVVSELAAASKAGGAGYQATVFAWTKPEHRSTFDEGL